MKKLPSLPRTLKGRERRSCFKLPYHTRGATLIVFPGDLLNNLVGRREDRFFNGCMLRGNHPPVLLAFAVKAFFGRPLANAFRGCIAIPNFHSTSDRCWLLLSYSFAQHGSVF